MLPIAKWNSTQILSTKLNKIKYQNYHWVERERNNTTICTFFCLNVLPSWVWQRVQHIYIYIYTCPIYIYIYIHLSWQSQIRMTSNPVVLSPKAYSKKIRTSEEKKLKHAHHNMSPLYGQWGHYIKLVNLIYMSWWVKMEASDACWSVSASMHVGLSVLHILGKISMIQGFYWQFDWKYFFQFNSYHWSCLWYQRIFVFTRSVEEGD